MAAHASLLFIRSTVAANRADSGGGIFATASLILMRTHVRGNRADVGSGGGIDAQHGVVRIIRSTVTGNRSAAAGGGVAIADQTFRLSKSAVAQNVAGAGGGGVHLLDVEGRITESTVNGNVAHGSGGGVHQSGSNLAVFNSTITRNRADATGGGIQSSAAGGQVMMNSVTVVRNVANVSDGNALGGGLSAKGGAFGVVNSIIALNRSASRANDCHGEFTSFGGNLLSTMDACRGFVDSALVRPDPRLGSLRYNGGPTRTLALKRGSPALDRANATRKPELDQRGRKRGARPDIGAFERLP